MENDPFIHYSIIITIICSISMPIKSIHSYPFNMQYPRPGAAEGIFMGRTLVMISASWHTGNVYIYICTRSNYEITYEVGIAHLTHT